MRSPASLLRFGLALALLGCRAPVLQSDFATDPFILRGNWVAESQSDPRVVIYRLTNVTATYTNEAEYGVSGEFQAGTAPNRAFTGEVSGFQVEYVGPQTSVMLPSESLRLEVADPAGGKTVYCFGLHRFSDGFDGLVGLRDGTQHPLSCRATEESRQAVRLRQSP